MSTNGETDEVNKDAEAPGSSRDFTGEIRKMQKKLVIRGENAREFARFAENLLSELGARNKIEMLYAEKFIFTAWKYHRAAELERNMLTEQNTPDTYKMEDDRRKNIKKYYRVRTIEKVNLFRDDRVRQLIEYQFELERSMDRALRRLRIEQGLPVTKFDEPNNEE